MTEIRGWGEGEGWWVSSMDQIFIKTPNPRCRLYWGLIEFIDWRYSQLCWYFWPLLWTSAPLTFSLVHLPPPPFLVWISTEVCIHTVCNGGGGGWEGIEGLRQITPTAKFLYSSIFKKSRRLGFGVFIDIWSMVSSPVHDRPHCRWQCLAGRIFRVALVCTA